jgi:hypothetical protein
MLSMICIVILFVCLCLIDLQIKKKNLDIIKTKGKNGCD